MLLARRGRRLHQHLPAHPEVHHHGEVAGRQLEPEVLAATAGAGDRETGQLRREIVTSEEVPAE